MFPFLLRSSFKGLLLERLFFFCFFFCFLSVCKVVACQSLSKVPLGNKETSVAQKLDLGAGINYSCLLGSLTGRIWEDVEYLTLVAGNGSYTKQDFSFSLGGFFDAGYVFKRTEHLRYSVGGEYSLSYFTVNSRFVYGEAKQNFLSPLLAPPKGSVEFITLEGFDHRLSPYVKLSFKLPKFLPLAVQFNMGLSFLHLFSMRLQDWRGYVYQVNNSQSLALRPSLPGSLAGMGIFPLNRFYDFSLRNTCQLGFVTGIKLYLGPVFAGFDYTTNVITRSCRFQLGLSLQSDFFALSW